MIRVGAVCKQARKGEKPIFSNDIGDKFLHNQWLLLHPDRRFVNKSVNQPWRTAS